MAKDFNIYTYPTFFSLLLIMLIPFALSVDDIMNNHQSNMKIILLISVFIIIILVYGLVKVIFTYSPQIGVEQKNMCDISFHEIFIFPSFSVISKPNSFMTIFLLRVFTNP